MAKTPIQINYLNQAEWLVGGEIIVIGGTAFSKPITGTNGYANSSPASGDEVVKVLSAGDNGAGGFFIEVQRPTAGPDAVNIPTEYIFSDQNSDTILIQPQITRNGVTETIDAPEETKTAKSTITAGGKTWKLSPVATIGVLLLATYGLVMIAKQIFKAATKTTL